MRRRSIAVWVVVAACGGDPSAVPDPAPDAPAAATPVTWFADAGPIVAKHCMACHRDGGIAPFALTGYADASAYAGQMVAEIAAGAMPPFGAYNGSDCAPGVPWKDDPRLSPVEIATLQRWIDGGLLAGSAAELVPAEPSALAGVTQTLAPSSAFVADGDLDELACTVLDPGATAMTWVTGLQVRPGNPTVVHHVIISELAAGSDQDALVAAHPIGVPFDCSALATPAGFPLDVWTPGNQPVETPDGALAIPITAGAKLVMQIHYHPAGTIAAPDVTSLDLRVSPTWPANMYVLAGFGNLATAPGLLSDPDDPTPVPEFTIPANIADHEEHMRFAVTLPDGLARARVYSVDPHMHLLGTRHEAKLTRAEPAIGDAKHACLANGDWNFDWQRTFVFGVPLDQLPAIATGDTLDIECHWNNTLANPFEQRLLADEGLRAPIDVHLGNATTDEMCVENFGLVVPAPPPP